MLRSDALTRTFIGTATLAGKEGYAVAQDGVATIQPWDNAAQPPLGILFSVDPKTPTCGDVALPGSIVWAKAGATITPGTHFFLTSDGDGTLKPASAGEFYVAIPVSRVAASDGDKIQVQVAIGQLA